MFHVSCNYPFRLCHRETNVWFHRILIKTVNIYLSVYIKLSLNGKVNIGKGVYY
jgi:hypothetical protein